MKSEVKAPAADMLRLFVALDLTSEIKQAIAAYVQPLRARASAVAWARGENLHLTLKFLGDTPRGQMPALAAALQAACTRFAPVHAVISGSGVFPQEKNPRVLWLRCEAAHDDLRRLAQEIDAVCSRFGYQPEPRPFVPHLTVGRVRPGGAGPVVRVMAAQPFPAQALVFHECVLMESELHAAGARYRPLYHFPFGGAGVAG